MLVSNAEYLEFVEAGGYTDRGKKWWSEEGWRFVQDLGVEGPRFWRGKTHYRMLLEVICQLNLTMFEKLLTRRSRCPGTSLWR